MTIEQPMHEPRLSEHSDLISRIEALQNALNALEKQYQRSGREQLKANALAERQSERLEAALESLRQADQRREAELEAIRERSQATTANARLEVAARMFSIVDGLDEALRAGSSMLQHSQSDQALLQDLLLGSSDTSHKHLQSWLEGLEFVRRRLLDALATEQISPIATVGYAFDPHVHSAIEAVSSSALPPGTVVHELRRGFVHGDRVMRHAEVTVAR